MPDITMCEGEGCPFKYDCYRYTATPDTYQSFFSVVPFENKKCDHFWLNKEIKSGRKTRQKVD